MKYTVTLGNRSLTKIIFGNELLIMLLLFPFFKTSGFDYIPGLSFFCNAMLFLDAVLFFLIYLGRKEMNPFFFTVILYEIWTYLLAPLIADSTPPSLFYVSGTLGVLSVFYMGFSEDYQRFMNALCKLFAIMISANLMLMLAFPGGFDRTSAGQIYLLGIRTGFSLFIIPGLMFNCIRDDLMNKHSACTVICLICGTLSLIMQWVATGLLELAVIILFFFMLKRRVSFKQKSFFYIFLGIMLFNFLLTYIGTNNGVMQFVAQLLKRDITFTGRTEIWMKTFARLQDSPLAGFGNDAVVLIRTVWKTAHNQWLHFALEGGYVAMIIMIMAIGKSCRYVTGCKNECWYGTFCSFAAGILIGCIAEIQTYVPFFYAVFMMPYLLKKFVKREVNNESGHEHNRSSV